MTLVETMEKPDRTWQIPLRRPGLVDRVGNQLKALVRYKDHRSPHEQPARATVENRQHVVGLDKSQTNDRKNSQNYHFDENNHVLGAACSVNAIQIDAEEDQQNRRCQEMLHRRLGSPGSEHRRAVASKGVCVQGESSDVADKQQPAAHPCDVWMAKSVFEVGKAAPVGAEGQTQPRIGRPREQRDHAPESESDWGGVAGKTDGQAENREDPAPDHSPDAHRHQLFQAELSIASMTRHRRLLSSPVFSRLQPL